MFEGADTAARIGSVLQDSGNRASGSELYSTAVEYEFFIDLFFAVSLFFNFLVLSITGVFLRQNPSIMRLLFSASVGSIWNCFLILFPIFPRYCELIFTSGIVGSLMIFCAFGIRNRNIILKGILGLLASSVFISGIVEFLRETFWLDDWEAIVLAGIMCAAGRCFFSYILRNQVLGDERYHVKLYYHGASKEFLALADSGNRLRTPKTGNPVSLIAYKDCRGFCDHVQAGFYIPYRAVGISDGMLFAVVLEKMEILKDGRIVVIERPVVAVSKESLSSDGTFSMLLPEEYIHG